MAGWSVGCWESDPIYPNRKLLTLCLKNYNNIICFLFLTYKYWFTLLIYIAKFACTIGFIFFIQQWKHCDFQYLYKSTKHNTMQHILFVRLCNTRTRVNMNYGSIWNTVGYKSTLCWLSWGLWDLCITNKSCTSTPNTNHFG